MVALSLHCSGIISTTLEGLGFEINPYDMCVANKVIEDTQFTIAFYVDDNKLSHKNPELISDIMNEAKIHFGGLSGVRGNKHNLLGMNIDIMDRTIQVYMVKNWGSV